LYHDIPCSHAYICDQPIGPPITPDHLTDRKDEYTNKVNYSGNHAKPLHISVEASLKKLRSSYIDKLYVHWWDWTTSVEEIMNALRNLVVQGKVLYLVPLSSVDDPTDPA
jgi:aryl-alcohol dehydrogenase-like predicted oxidoreductase